MWPGLQASRLPRLTLALYHLGEREELLQRVLGSCLDPASILKALDRAPLSPTDRLLTQVMRTEIVIGEVERISKRHKQHVGTCLDQWSTAA